MFFVVCLRNLRHTTLSESSVKDLVEKLFHALMLYNGVRRINHQSDNMMMNSDKGEFMLQFSSDTQGRSINNIHTMINSKWFVVYIHSSDNMLFDSFG